MIQCKAAIADSKGNFSIQDIEVDNPKGDEVLVETKAKKQLLR